MDNTHILVFPLPAQGHMLPLLDLTNLLAVRGFSITIIVTPETLPTLSPILSAHPSSIQTLVLPIPSHSGAGIHQLVAALPALATTIADWFNSHPSPPRAIISDFFLGWTQQLAQDHLRGIPRVAFFSSGAFLASVLALLFSDAPTFKALGDPLLLADLPRSPVFELSHLPAIFRMYDHSDPRSRASKDNFLANLSSSACVFNSFTSLEPDYLDYFTKRTLHGRVFAFGPLSQTCGLRGGPHDHHEVVLRWLNDCPDSSVLYVSFGTQKRLTQPQLHALAQALEKSGARFVWVVPPGPETDHLPDGPQGGRGYVVKGWAPQVEILAHGAVGGFLSHCGWNSTLESVVAGVVVLAWPMEADQFINARLLVEDMGVAVRACEGRDTMPDPDELGRVIKEAMLGLDHTLRSRARELKDKALAAVTQGGTSAMDLDEFVSYLFYWKIN